MVAKKHHEQLDRIKNNVKNAHDYFRKNVKRYHDLRKFVFDTSISKDDENVLEITKKPKIECNIIEAFISKLRGEFSKQEPSITVSQVDDAPINPKIIDTVEGHFRSILFNANNDSFEYDVYTDLLSGGFSVIKVWTEYESSMGFKQVIRLGRPHDVTTVGFDPLARKPHKGDGNFCYEYFPKRRDEFEQENPGIDISKLTFVRDTKDDAFNWTYTNDKDEILIICDYYEKKKKKAKLVQLSTGQAMLKDDYIEFLAQWDEAVQRGLTVKQAPAAVNERWTTITTVCRYRLIADQIIEYIETDYDLLPLIFVDGNSVLLKNNDRGTAEQMTRPYAWHVQGTQRLKNFAMQSLAAELENMVQHKWIVDEETIPPEYIEAYKNPQIPSNLVFKGRTVVNNQVIPLAPPQPVPRVPIPPEIMNTFAMTDQSTQMVLGSFDAQLGINNNQLSGVAIVEGATQSNAAAMPYIVGFLKGLNQAAQLIVNLIPKYNKTQGTLPVRDSKGKSSFMQVNSPDGIKLQYAANTLHVRVEAGVNFAVQKSKALQQIIALMQASPLFAQFINTMGLEVLIKNLEIYNVDELEELAQKFMQQMQKQQATQQQQPNPQMLKQQLDQQKFAYEQQQDQLNNQLKQAEIANTAQANENDKLKILLDAQQAGNNTVVQQAKANTEAYSKSVELALQAKGQSHTHAKEAIELAHMVTNTPTQNNQPTTGSINNG